MADCVDKRFGEGERAIMIQERVSCATTIQKTRHTDSIVARALHVADFINGIGTKRTKTMGPSASANDPFQKSLAAY